MRFLGGLSTGISFPSRVYTLFVFSWKNSAGVLFCLVSLAPKLFALIISQLFSCIPVLCCPGFPICSVSGDVTVGAEGTFGYILVLEFW